MLFALEVAISLFLLLGSFFVLVGAIGLVRLPDFVMRLHAPTKATTPGVGGMLIVSMLFLLGTGRLVIHEVLVTLFLFVTAPVFALMLAKAAMHLRLPSRARLPPDSNDGTPAA